MILKWWRLSVWFIRIVSDNDYTKSAYPWWYVKLPRYFNASNLVGFDLGVVLSHSVSLYFSKKKVNEDD